MNIANKIKLSFFIAILFVGIVITSIVYYEVKKILQVSITEQLITTIQSRQNHIETFLEMQRNAIIQMSESVVIKDFLSSDKQTAVYIESYNSVMKRLQCTEVISKNVYEIFVLDVNGKIVVSSDKKNIGLDKSNNMYFLSGKVKSNIKDAYFSKTEGRGSIAFSAPIIESNTEKLLGVVVARIGLGLLDKITMDNTGLKKTGEIYLINKYGYMITPSRFIEETYLKQKINLKSMTMSFSNSKKNGDETSESHFFSYKDYRGISVFGTYVPIKEMNWVLVVKIDEKEVIVPLVKILLFVFGLHIILILIALLMTNFVAGFITKPIRKLCKGTEIIGSGNLNYKVATQVNDEIGQLSLAFDKMTESLKMTVVSKDYVDNIIKNMADILVVATPDGKIGMINRATLDNFGYNEQELIGKDVNILFSEEESIFKGTKLQQLIRGGSISNYEVNLKTKDGGKILVLLSCAVMRDQNGNITDIICVAKNITEFKKAENQLKQAHTNTKVILERTQVGVVVIGKDKKIRWANECIRKMAGVENIDVLIGKSCGKYLCPAAQDKCPILDLNKRIDNSERIFRREDGREMPIIKTVNEINFDNEDVLLETFIDITNRKKAEEALKESAEKVRTLYDSSSDAIMLLDEKGFFDCNDATLRLFGCANKEDFCSKHPADFSPLTQPDGTDTMSYAKNNIERALKEGSLRFEHLHRRLNGVNFSAEVLLDVMLLGGKKVLQARVFDITERKKAEWKLMQVNKDLLLNERALKNMLYDISKTHQELENAQTQLVQSEKLSSLGQLSAGIAHEINNPLGFISNNIDILDEYVNSYSQIIRVIGVLKKTIEDKDLDKAASVVEEINKLDEKLNLEFIATDIRDLIEQTKSGTVRIKKIINDLKIFSRKDEGRLELSNVEEILDRVINIVWNEIKYKIELKKEYGGIPLVRCNTQKIGQVFINLIVNASQAVKEKGVIIVKTYLIDKSACIEISDTGSGIEKADIDKIFDPFFTTKEVGKGTGLGLSIGYDIIKQHGGEIKVESEVNKGTKFIIKLPV